MWIAIVLFFALTVSLYYFNKNISHYWSERKVPHLKPTPLFGNYGDFILLRTTIGNVLREICEKFPTEPYIGSFYGTKPSLIVKDPELIKTILTKDFYYFNGREISDYTEREPCTKGVFFSHGDKWKIVRQNLTPLYTTSKMKNMFPLMEHCSRILENVLEDQIQIDNIVKITDLMASFSIDCIALAAFGIESNVMLDSCNKENTFKIMSERIFEKSTYRGVKNICRAIWPDIFYGLGFHSYRRDINGFFLNILHKVFKERGFQPSNKNDFVDLILGFTNKEYLVGDSIKHLKTGEFKKISIKVDEELLASQCVSFLGAGYETSAVTMSLTLFEMAKNEHTQVKVFEEIDEYLELNNNVLLYDCVLKLPYLEACIDETLRLYPSLGNLTRDVTEDYTFSTGLHVEKGLRIHIPVSYIHHHPTYFPEPEKFIPERFLLEERHKIKPFTYLPFGEGFRFCIGKRFAKMQMISGLVTIFKSYKVQLAEGQPSIIKFDPRVVINRPIEHICLKLTHREKKSQVVVYINTYFVVSYFDLPNFIS